LINRLKNNAVYDKPGVETHCNIFVSLKNIFQQNIIEKNGELIAIDKYIN